jgi:hypothetical protein
VGPNGTNSATNVGSETASGAAEITETRPIASGCGHERMVDEAGGLRRHLARSERR